MVARARSAEHRSRHLPGGSLTALAVLACAAVTLFVALWLVRPLLGGVTAVVADGPNSVEVLSAIADPSAEVTTAPEPAASAAAMDVAPPKKAHIPLAVATLAWQPSHQADTGYDGWREYEICGDIMRRAIARMSDFEHVEAWTLEHGLTGRNSYRPNPLNTEAFDVELALANEASADAFISIHNDGGAPSGVLGMCMPGDAASRALCEALVASICAETGLPNRGIREERLYSLEPDNNGVPLRLLLEIGDNVRDREYLENPGNRDRIAEAIATGIRAWDW